MKTSVGEVIPQAMRKSGGSDVMSRSFQDPESSNLTPETPPTPSALALAMAPQQVHPTDNLHIDRLFVHQDPGLVPYSVHKKRKGSLEKREQMMVFALRNFQEQLGLESEASLLGNIEIREIPEGFRIMEEDSLKDAALVCLEFVFTFTLVAFCYIISTGKRPKFPN